ncbi:pilus assembly protein PilP [Solimonas variicoloris]|uniref:pilus assembly protein PilP n=1 Tax=Solimonas variicoloris TaxID=254408 RepID=UPI0003676696|nr:pilus assembly protein PilP [Solimonas variicoloris]
MSRALASCLLLGGLLALAGCGGGASDLDRYIAEVKARKTKDIEPIPQIKPYQPFEYVADERRDPFVFVERAAENANPTGPRPDLRRNKEPLEEFPLDALRMVGIIATPAGTYALVKAPDGVVHRVAVHNHMGQNYGEIVRISESEVSLLELVPDGFGGWTQRPASLALSQ